MLYRRIFILALLTIVSLSTFAQRYEIGVIGAMTGYMGDINTQNPVYFKSMGGGISGKYNFNPTWGAKLSLNQIHIKGDDYDFKNSFQQDRNLKFQNRITEMSLTAEFNFFTAYNKDLRRTPKFTPYLFSGIGVIRHSPYIYYDANNINLNKLRLEYDEANNPGTYSTINMSIPLGFGIKYKLSQALTVGTEVSYRLALTDNIDNVSKYYATSIPDGLTLPFVTVTENGERRFFNTDDWEFLADPSLNLALKAGTARGDGRNRDGYMTLGITFSYSLFSADCYNWRK